MYQKEIIYIGLYKDGNRVGSAGFLKLESRERESRLYLKIQNIPHGISGRFPIRVYNGNDWKELNGVTIQDGSGNWEENLAENVDRTIIQVMMPGGYVLEGKSKSAPEMNVPRNTGVQSFSDDQGTVREPQSMPQTDKIHEPQSMPQTDTVSEPQSIQQIEVSPEPQNTEQKEPTRSPETIIVTEELPRRSSGDDVFMPQSVPDCNLKEDKWEQILSTFENIHPYGDERVYVKLEPKDFVILQSKYQHLVNNSFLLHGFYNYRYVILGKEQDYYLGVPGVFYEREKMVAQMFGFEAFECPGGNVRAGEFGYYLRKVEL